MNREPTTDTLVDGVDYGLPSKMEERAASGSSFTYNGMPYNPNVTANYINLLDAATNRVVVPTREECPNRTLVCCFDGTGDRFDADNSNIVKLFSMLKKDDPTKQMVYYQTGIGTIAPRSVTPLWTSISKTIDGAVAWHLDSHVMAGYEFLMQNYVYGDKICLFGFSRGSYTARALAGMLHKVGLLPPCNHQQVPFAYKMFTQADESGWKQSTAFKRTFSIDVQIEFIGVFDTVNSVGLIPHRLPFTTSNTVVRTFRHALALDERRAKFKANFWNKPTAEEEKLDKAFAPPPPTVSSGFALPRMSSLFDKNSTSKDGRHPVKSNTLRALEQRFANQQNHTTDIEEVWFAGAHCDVGGGSVPNETPHSLARIPLRWMIRECFKSKTGILFDAGMMQSAGIDPATLYPVVQTRPPPLTGVGMKVKSRNDDVIHVHVEGGHEGTEEEEELHDALSPIYDQLSMFWFKWGILELLPLRERYQRGDKSWGSKHTPNLGGPRFIPKQQRHGVKVHRSVKIRMEAGYKAKALFSVEPTWVD